MNLWIGTALKNFGTRTYNGLQFIVALFWLCICLSPDPPEFSPNPKASRWSCREFPALFHPFEHSLAEAFGEEGEEMEPWPLPLWQELGTMQSFTLVTNSSSIFELHWWMTEFKTQLSKWMWLKLEELY